MGEDKSVLASCHCGAVEIRLPFAPDEVKHCNCSLCRRYGVIWGYYPIADVIIGGSPNTDTYAWNGKHVDFHRCGVCGCLTHWLPRKISRTSMGINMRLIEPALLARARIVYQDAAGTGLFT